MPAAARYNSGIFHSRKTMNLFHEPGARGSNVVWMTGRYECDISPFPNGIDVL